jgi:hypothetical protein
MLTREDLPKRNFVRPSDEAVKINTGTVDAWFHLWALPASLYLGWLRNLHREARRAARSV